MERDPNIEIERNPARRGPVVERTVPAVGPTTAPLAVRQADRVEWGPIWAGFFVSVLTLVVLGSLAAAIGLAAVDPGAAATPDWGTGITALVVMLAALFVGGWACGYLMENANSGFGALNGVVLAGLTLSMLLLVSTAGVLSASNVLSGILRPINLSQLAATGQSAVAGLTPEQIAANAATAAGWFTAIALLSIGAAALGAYLGVRTETTRGVRHTEA